MNKELYIPIGVYIKVNSDETIELQLSIFEDNKSYTLSPSDIQPNSILWKFLNTDSYTTVQANLDIDDKEIGLLMAPMIEENAWFHLTCPSR